MKKENIEVLRKILYAVESGGQVYGKQNYAAFAGVGANTTNEKAITIGAGQWYANEAKKLLQKIKEKYSDTFEKYDTAGIAADLEKSWNNYGCTKTSKKGKAIVAIISSDAGIKCQDELMEEQIQSYEKSITATYGAMPDDAMMECINIIHQGGSGALKRILGKTATPLSAKNIYAALCTDPADKSSDNQVGDYVTRQKKVYEFITKYVAADEKVKGDKTMTELELRQSVANWLAAYQGISEGSAKHQEILDIYNNSKLCTRHKMTVAYPWCATAVSAAFIAKGLAGKTGSGAVFECVECSCNEMINLAKKQGTWVENDAYKPTVGDVVLYDWQDSGKGDNTGVPDHVGIVYSVSGNSFRVVEGNISNTVGFRKMAVNGTYIRGYIVPKYAKKASGASTNQTNQTSAASSSGTSLNKTEKWSGKVNADGVNVRKWAGTENETCSFSPLNTGTAVSVCDSVKASDGSTWYYIKYDGKYGFMHSDYVSKNATASQPDTSATVQSKTASEAAHSKDNGLAGTYKTTAALNIRNGAGTVKNKFGSDKTVLVTAPAGTKVQCYGYFTTVDAVRWLYVQFTYNGVKYTGFASSKYLNRQ